MEIFTTLKRSAVAKLSVVTILAVLIAAGGVALYTFTMPASTGDNNGATTASTSAGNESSQPLSVSSTETTSSDSTTLNCQNAQGQPTGICADYLGYIPAGYSLTPHLPGAATYPCPAGMGAAQCKVFQASCGNGVCDPNESCSSCPIDCGVSGQLTCDPYTGRPGAPISICQLGGAG
jgi:hypothetical protein